jgi:hypothetical protein
MRKFSFTVAAVMTFLAAGTAMADSAAAAPTGGGNAADTVRELQAQGFNVQINGSMTDPLSECVTTGVHGVPASGTSTDPRSGAIPFTTVYVDIQCPDVH